MVMAEVKVGTRKYKTTEKQRERSIAYHAANKEARNDRARVVWAANKERHRNNKLKYKFGIDSAKYDEMLLAQEAD
jgi:hypothetical protein